MAELLRAIDGRPVPSLVGGRVLNADRTEQRGARRGDITPVSALLSLSHLSRRVPSWRRYDADDEGSSSSGWSVTPDPEVLAMLRPGLRVRHDLYGNGVVRRLAGRGTTARAIVRFDDGVEREFVLEYAGLTPLEDSQF